jgi:hypothetical protein
MDNPYPARLVEFDDEPAPLAAGTPAAPRPEGHPRQPPAEYTPPVFMSFDCECVAVPPGTVAPARPEGKERHLPPLPPLPPEGQPGKIAPES